MAGATYSISEASMIKMGTKQRNNSLNISM
uniref:Uncharacterized protein n=1 Tax=Arundo donax TaxID=35708 RepID=A0A0A9FZ17_ARUDO